MKANQLLKQWIEPLGSFLSNKILGTQINDSTDLDYWKQKIFIISVAVYLFGGFPLMLLGSWLFYQDGLTFYSLLQASLSLIVSIILINQRVSQQTRSFTLLIFFLITSFSVIFLVSLQSAGMLILLGTLFLSALLLNSKALRLYFSINLLTSTLITTLLFLGYFDTWTIASYKRVWLLHMLITQVAGMGFAMIVRNMHHSLTFQNKEMLKSIQASEESHQRFQLSIANSPVPSIIYTSAGDIISINHAWEKTTGYKIEDITSLSQWFNEALSLSPSEISYFMSHLISSNENHFDGILSMKTTYGTVISLAFYTSMIGKDSLNQSLLLSVGIDLTEQLKAEKLYNSIIETTNDAFILLDKHGTVLNVNETSCEMLELSKEQLMGQKLLDIDVSSQHQNIAHYIKQVLQVGTIRFESKHQRRDGTILDLDVSANTIQTDDTYIFIFFRDVSLKNKQIEEMLHISTHDSLTNLFNRSYIQSYLQNMVYGHHTFAIIIFDINGIKLVNDSLGYDAGDTLLKDFSAILQRNTRNEDLLARSGGSEFIIYVHNSSQEIVSDIVRAINQNLDTYNQQVCKPLQQLSTSYGYAHRHQAENIFGLLAKAQQHLTNNKLSEKRSLRNSLLNSIVTTLAEKSHETKDHASRLSELCTAMGQRLHMAEHHISELHILAFLHDIGKIGIPDSILNKPGPLTKDEWLTMKKHPEIGYRIALASGELESVANYILAHHEKWDGTGYPLGLKGHDIPIHSRIIAIVDAFDAMTSDRIYRKGMSISDALNELTRCSNTQFDPQLVPIFIEIIQNETLA